RTRSIIATVDSVIQEQYESYKYRPLPVVIPAFNELLPTADIFSYEIMPSEAARVRLMMTRDLQRMELPDKVSDIRRPPARTLPAAPASITAVADRVIEKADGSLGLARPNAEDLTERSPF